MHILPTMVMVVVVAVTVKVMVGVRVEAVDMSMTTKTVDRSHRIDRALIMIGTNLGRRHLIAHGPLHPVARDHIMTEMTLALLETKTVAVTAAVVAEVGCGHQREMDLAIGANPAKRS
jgi:hypothetical protein